MTDSDTPPDSVADSAAELRIRDATPADADALAAVYHSAYRENRRLGFPAKAETVEPATVAEWIREHQVFVAEVPDGGDADIPDGTRGGTENRLVGGVRLEETEPDRAKVSRFGVHDDWKGRGVGSRLLAHAETAARNQGYATVWLTTPGEHPQLPDFYRERGYEQTGEYPLNFRDYDEIVMEKRLE